jgi:8-amino-7-oxononanoate synthase
VLKNHPNISVGRGTIFIAVESLYSMDGDFAPLPEIVELVDELIPKGCAHIFVDEAHTTGIYGSKGRGLVSLLGLEDKVDTIMHVFSKSYGVIGGE